MGLESKSFGDLITYTRTGVATLFNSAGVLTTVPANTPRFDHDPFTLQPLGLLIEGARTNQILNSDAPVPQDITVTAAARCLTFYGTGTVTLSGAFSGSLVGVGVFPNRALLRFTPAAGTLTLTISGTVQFAQLELGQFPSTYIPTAGAAVARGQDIARVQTGAFTPWFRDDAGVILVDGSTFYDIDVGGNPTNATEAPLLSFGTLVTNQFGLCRDDQSGNVFRARCFWRSDGSASSAILPDANNSYPPNVVNKFAVAMQAGNYRASYNGGNVVLSDVPTNVVGDRLNIGANYTTSALFGHVRRIRYFPRTPPPDAELQSLSAA